MEVTVALYESCRCYYCLNNITVTSTKTAFAQGHKTIEAFEMTELEVVFVI